MGWKAIRDYYGIRGAISVGDRGIYFGSLVTQELIISHEGEIVQRCDSRGHLKEYQAAMDADLGKLRELAQQIDDTNGLTKIYTYWHGEIFEKWYEAPEWPNETIHDKVIYYSTFSTDRDEVVALALEKANARKNLANTRLTEARKEVDRALLELEECDRILESLRSQV